MSKYTTEVRFLCETLAGYTEQQGYSSIDDILTTAAPLVFNFDFPIFDEDYRLPLEKKILKHFYTREISEESVGLWKLRLDARLNEIMPYYNKLYESELLVFNPLQDTDLTTTHTKENEGETSDNGTTTGETTNTQTKVTDYEETTTEDNSKTQGTTTSDSSNLTSTQTTSTTGTEDSQTIDRYSDTPQGALDGVMDFEYLTNARVVDGDVDTTSKGTVEYSETGSKSGSKNVTQTEDNGGTKDYDKTETTNGSGTSSSVSASTGTSNSTEEYIQNVVGKRGSSSYAKLLLEFRDTFLNIDMQIINDLNNLFFNLW